MGLNASWVPGTAVVPQKEGYFISKIYEGHGATFTTTGQQWFHFAIPTPVLIEGKRVSAHKFFFFYKTSMTAKINQVNVYDGNKIFKAYYNINLSGDHSNDIEEKINSLTLDTPHEMKYGFGISILVDFGDSTRYGVPSIKFTGAGVDFYTN